MKKILFFILFLLFYTTGSVLAVEISWMHVQHRQYGEGKSVNRLSFGLIDDQGRYLTDDKNIKEVKLLDPRGKEIKLSAYKFRSIEEVYGTYDTKNGQWIFNKDWQFDSWFSADVLEPLIPETYYWLRITFADGKLAERTYNFNSLIALPRRRFDLVSASL